MAYINVDVDIDEFDTHELVQEICRRLSKERGRKSLTPKQKEEIKEEFSALQDALNFSIDAGIAIRTLDNKIKYEHLAIVFNKYTVEQIQGLLPE